MDNVPLRRSHLGVLTRDLRAEREAAHLHHHLGISAVVHLYTIEVLDAMIRLKPYQKQQQKLVQIIALLLRK